MQRQSSSLNPGLLLDEGKDLFHRIAVRVSCRDSDVEVAEEGVVHAVETACLASSHTVDRGTGAHQNIRKYSHRWALATDNTGLRCIVLDFHRAVEACCWES